MSGTNGAPRPDGPTELVETDRGELVERLSAGTATLLLIWLIVIGAGSALLAAWVVVAVVLRERLGAGALFSEFGLYLAFYGATGPLVLWLAGRAQGHSLRWFLWTAAKIGLVMAGISLAFGWMVSLVIGLQFELGIAVLLGAAVIATLLISVLWGLATWAADRWIALARVVR